MIKITLTTIPSRFFRIKPTLARLNTQKSSEPFEVHLYLGKDYKRLPGKFRKETAEEFIGDLAKVHWVEDIGPITKYFYALRDANSDDIIVSADDDIQYCSEWLEGLLQEYRKDDSSNYCYRGRIFPNNTLCSYMDTELVWSHEVNELTPISIITGVYGSIYNPHWFSPNFFEHFDNNKIRSAYMHVDDPYISAYLANKEIKRQVVPMKGIEHNLELSRVDALHHINWRTSHNDEIMEEYRDAFIKDLR